LEGVEGVEVLARRLESALGTPAFVGQRPLHTLSIPLDLLDLLILKVSILCTDYSSMLT
jgi:hypothetical protein